MRSLEHETGGFGVRTRGTCRRSMMLWQLARYLVTGRFANLPLRHLDVSHLWMFRYQDVSPPDDEEVLTASQITNFQTGGAASEMQVAKRSGIETSKGAKRAGGDSSMANWQSSKTCMNH